ncbi:ROK family protein [Micromonospora sp. NPDC005305]|uniref:ROK family protein n=1 Tax=Micromonospora sp. NPDC005305 TaxID=3156875 RepID=UPI0033B25FA7
MTDAQPPPARPPYRPSRTWGRRLIAAADGAAVVDALVAAGRTVGVEDLAASLGLTVPRARAAVRAAQARRLVEVTGDGVTRRPRPAGAVLAVDVGGTKIRAALADRHGEVVAELVVPAAQRGLVDQIAQVQTDLVDRAGPGVGPVLAGCVGIPACYDPVADRAWNAGNLPELYELRPAKALRAALGLPVVLAQDVRLAAAGERWRGRAKGRDDFVVLCLGTGVALGIVINAEVYGGGQGGAGEISYLPLGNDPFAAEHRDRGPYEDAVSGPALARRYAGETPPAGPGQGAREARLVFEAAATGDAAAARVLDREAELLAMGIAAVTATIDPQLVVLAGGLGSNPALLDPVRRHIGRLLHRPPAIEPSPLAHRGPLHGAIAVALASVPPARAAQTA